MSAWRYCWACSQPLTPPTLREALKRERVCPGCRKGLEVPEDDLDYAADEIERKLAALVALASEVGREI